MSGIFRTIVADPPWQVMAGPSTGPAGFGGAKGRSRALAYPSMTVEQMEDLPVDDLAHPDGCHLYLWTINRYVDEAYALAIKWGFQPSTLLTWCKSTMGHGLGGAFGISTEFVLFCRKGRLQALRKQPGTWWLWQRPYDERGKPRHSAKPPEFFQMVEGVSPGPRVELFARAERPGWHRWGNEVASNINWQTSAVEDIDPMSGIGPSTQEPK